jgi:hypothetical protein
MRHIRIPVIQQPHAEDLVDGLAVFDLWGNWQENIYLTSFPLVSGNIRRIKTYHIQRKLILVLSMHHLGAKDLRKPLAACQG